MILYTFVEKLTPKELDADSAFISECQDNLETCYTEALFGKLGSGKRTLAAQVAIRLAKKDTKLKIKIVKGGDLLSEGLESRNSSILIIHDPLKTWFTIEHTDKIINCLLNICTNAPKNNCYILAIFHCNDPDSFERRIGEKNKAAIVKMFSNRTGIKNNKKKITELAKSNKPVTIQTVNASIGETLIVTLYQRNLAFKDKNFLSNPTKFIFEKLKKLEKSQNISDQLAFKVMIIFITHDREIAKREMHEISHHALFNDLKEKIVIEKYIDECIKQYLHLFVEETSGGQFYRIMHDVITRCTFIAAVENHRTLLLTKCNPILIFDCIGVKSADHKIKYSKCFLDSSYMNIGIPSERYQEIARLLFQRNEMEGVLRNSRLFDDKKFQDEWKKAKLYFTNERHEKNERDQTCILS